MPDKKEYQEEVFIYTTGTERQLVVIDEESNNVFMLELVENLGAATEEKKKDMKSIGVFNIY